MIHCLRAVLKARGKLKENATELASLNQWQYADFEFLNVFGRPFALLVGKLLPGFDCELEIRRRALRPTF